MKLKHFVSACLAVMALGACSEDNVENITNESEFRIESSIAATRAPQLDANGAGKFVDGDKNSVFFHTSANKVLYSMTYTYGEKYFWESFNLPEATKSCNISACYPVVTTDTPASFAWDIQEHSSEPDFMIAAVKDANTQSSDPVMMTFSHALHKMVVTLKAESAYVTDEMLSKAEVTCKNLLPVANVNLLSGEVANASGNPISLAQNGKQATFIIPAQNVGKMEIVIKLGDRQKSFTLSSINVNGQALSKLESGKSFTLNIGVNKEHIFVINPTINGWGDQGSADGTITVSAI